jgi:hypothetical protein
MNAVATKVDDLFPEDVKSPEPSASPSVEDANVLSFPTSGLRVQDVVLQMLLDGKGYDEIATTVKKPTDAVRKIARSEWAKKEITKQIVDAAPGSQRDTLQNLIRIQAFDAVQKLGKLMMCGAPTVELGACKLALQYALPVPTVKNEGPKTSTLPNDPDEIKRQLEEMEREIARRQNPNQY